MTQEATLLISRALTEPQPFSWDGKYYHYQTVAVWPGLIQRPHPPLFSSGNSFESASFAASQRHGLAVSFVSASYITRIIPHYRAEAAKHGWEPQKDQIVLRGNIILTDTDEEAQHLAARLATLSHLRRPQSSAASTSPTNLINTAQFCGSPQTVVQQMKELSDLGVGVVDLLIPGNLMSQEKVLHALELFGKEVLPRMHDFA